MEGKFCILCPKKKRNNTYLDWYVVNIKNNIKFTENYQRIGSQK